MESPYLLPIGLLVIGIVLLFVEAVVPSLGILLVAGLVAAIAGIVLAFNVSATFGVITVIVAAIAAPLVVLLFFHVARKTNLVLSDAEQEYIASKPRDYLVGKTGVASTYLRPSGIALIDGKRIDVTAEADFLPEGTPVEVVRADGIKVVVRKKKEG